MKNSVNNELLIKKLVEGLIEKEVNSESNLKNEGLDSKRIIQLIVGIESALSIEIDDDDLIVENFSTINKIVGFLSAKHNK
ncbi:acyl carrier protein (plasmid) [Alkalihalophilus pseudofirmus]|uniref:acyl carrier protein n=1 Tax=Alkalihalophilus pseudofirmus TaxID=79885 RepID=UPI00259BEF44|nr:acyl carrier protein [Alkalihalophilus pseudofirmus]WEG19161.1 acyl carrier protein [Alkalihalophilus pseudofirmus]